ncbi:MAG: TonB family protein [Candidatus Acidiferrales bacterium]
MRYQALSLALCCSIFIVACGRETTKSNSQLKSPLTLAAEKGDVAAVTKLLGGRAHVNDVDKDGYTALHRASHCGDVRVVKTLIAAGADVNARTKANVTPLLVSIDMMCPNSEVTLALIQAGADVNVAETGGDTAIVIAATEAGLEVMRELLERGANPNTQGMDGETALHYAAMNGLLERVELLLQSGARLDIKNSQGKTAFDVARPEAKKLMRRKVESSLAGFGKNPVIKGPFKFAPTEGYTGPATVKFAVGENGKVSDVHLTRSSGVRDIDQKVVEAYSGWKYTAKPGRPVIESEVSVIVDWR